MPPEQKTFKELLLERLEAKGLNAEKIFQATEIPKHYLEFITRGEWSKLPPAPYVRGYFKKIAPMIDWDATEMWSTYHNEVELLKTSGETDRLPGNRFLIKRRNLTWVWPTLAAILVIVYGSMNINRLLGKPELAIMSPISASLVTSLPSFSISGKADPKDKLFINNEEVFIEQSGEFQKEFGLQTGLNTFEIVAKRFLGRETKVVKQIIYQIEPTKK